MLRGRLFSFGSAAVLLLLAGLWFLTLAPQSVGGPAAYVVVSGVSMQHSYQDGDLVIMRRKASYGIGDVVAYRIPEGEQGAGSFIIHRVVNSDERGFITQGDNRDGVDLWRPTERDIVGESWLHLPGAGSLLSQLKAPLPLATMAAAFAVYVVLTWGRHESPGRSDQGRPMV